MCNPQLGVRFHANQNIDYGYNLLLGKTSGLFALSSVVSSGMSLKTELIRKTVTTDTKIQCVIECLQTDLCFSVAFFPTSKR